MKWYAIILSLIIYGCTKPDSWHECMHLMRENKDFCDKEQKKLKEQSGNRIGL